MGIDKVSGLSTSVINMIYHRESGLSDTAQTPYPGLSKAGTVTMEGIYLGDLRDVKPLEQWHKQCKGEVPAGVLGGYRRNITIRHQARGTDNVDHLSRNKNLPATKQFVLRDAVCKSLKIGDLDANSQDFAKWSMEVEFREMDVNRG
jgi:hypothetical protein